MSKFEEILEELNAIVKKLEDDNLPLEEAVNLYDQGVKLFEAAAEILKKAETKIEHLSEEIEKKE